MPSHKVLMEVNRDDICGVLSIAPNIVHHAEYTAVASRSSASVGVSRATLLSPIPKPQAPSRARAPTDHTIGAQHMFNKHLIQRNIYILNIYSTAIFLLFVSQTYFQMLKRHTCALFPLYVK